MPATLLEVRFVQHGGLELMPAPLTVAGLVAAIVAMQDTDVFRSVSEAAKVRCDRTMSHRESRRCQIS